MRVAVAGAGFMGGVHAKAYQTMDGVEIAAIYAPSPNRGKPLADDVGSRWTDDLEGVLTDPEIDAIDICLPTPQHRSAAEAALAAGKHVLLEKPIAMNLADADALVAAAAASDRVFIVAHVLRFWPEYVELAHRVASGEFGAPRSGVATRRQPFPAWSALFSRADLTGGAVVDMMIHDYDALNWVFGQPVAVTARGARNPRSGGIDQVQVLIDYASGASALVDGGMMMPESYPFSSTLEVLCERGALEYAFRAGGRSVEMGSGVNDLTLFPNEGDPQRLKVAQHDPYHAECAAFIAAIQTGTPNTEGTPAQARTALAVALAARDSIERGGERTIVED
ncbi:MAG: Gfo/Idh/MocA family oxidoreductase [Thermomicrobiales bacterium]|nr:Gfo/Idh/MocA family oxidoreductase [Thermomicrobiales bacterium]